MSDSDPNGESVEKSTFPLIEQKEDLRKVTSIHQPTYINEATYLKIITTL